MTQIIYREKDQKMAQYYLISTYVPERLSQVISKYQNIMALSYDYLQFARKPSKKSAKKLLEISRSAYAASDYSIMYRSGLLDEDFYFWLGYHHIINFDWDDKLKEIVPFSFVFFNYDARFWNEKKGMLAKIKNIKTDTYKKFLDYMHFWDRFVVDLRNPCNAYFLGYVMAKVPGYAKRVRIIRDTTDKQKSLLDYLFKPLKGKKLQKYLKEIET